MAPKRQQAHPPARTQRTNSLFWTKARPLALAGYILALAAVSSSLSQLSLSPVYGSIPSAAYHQKIITGTVLLAFASKSRLQQYLPRNVISYLPVFAFYVPAIQFLMFRYSGQLGVTLGPVVTELLTFYPLLFLSAYCTAEYMQVLGFGPTISPIVAETVPALAAYWYLTTLQKFFNETISQIPPVTELFTRTSMQLMVASSYVAIAPSKLCLLAIPAMLHTARMNPHFMSPHTTYLVNQTLHSHGWNLLERRESNTGYVSIVENLQMQYRVMRCDHSLLGGEWLLNSHRTSQGITVAEPIYAVFEMLEAVRLIKTLGGKKSDPESNALVIGLGIGTAPKALLAHKINTTVVELDPVVHEFALRYFDLPPAHEAVLQNAVTWVDSVAHQDAGRRFDYIIHDVFTGGAEPLPLFTEEFLHGLKSLLKTSDGVIAINYAGDLATESTKQVLNTVNTVFDKRCRMFRDTPADPSSSKSAETDFLNMVIFCHPSSSTPITFRQPVEADYLGSQSRRQYLLPKPELELRFPTTEEMEQLETRTLTKSNLGEFEKRQTESARRHWEIMRTVVPAAVWENW